MCPSILFMLQPLQRSHEDVSLFSRTAKPKDHAICLRIDLPHLLDLVTALLEVLLVDTNSIHPKNSVQYRTSKVTESKEKIFSHTQVFSVNSNGYDKVHAPPCIR